ncbi:MAG: deacetylase, partial [Bacteroidetes bacterium QS_8_68_15]
MENASPDHVNLFVVGVNKAGTSWLYKLLQEHPDVFMSSQKELFYFGERHPEELTDYHAHFPFDRPYRYFGEATLFYCHDAAVARKIHDYAPDAKVLAIVRDPVERL